MTPTAIPARDFDFVVLAVTADNDDFRQIEAAMPGWTILEARNCRDARQILGSRTCQVVLCERALADGVWTDLIRATQACPDTPPIVVMSRVADEDMWAEVLSRGGLDLVAKPLAAKDLRRALTSWRNQAANAACATA